MVEMGLKPDQDKEKWYNHILDYVEQGWQGKLIFRKVICHLEQAEILYVVFYILILLLLFSDLGHIGLYESLVIGTLAALLLAYYTWMLRALWLSANGCEQRVCRYMIRLSALILPLLIFACYITFALLYILQHIFLAFLK